METQMADLGRGPASLLAAVLVASALLVTSCGGSGGGSSAAANTASAPGFSESSPSIAFGNQSVGTTSTAQTDTLTNAGTGTLNISSVQVSGPNASDFAATNTCGSSLAPSAQCTLTVTLTPSAAGVRTASVVFTDSATGSPQSITLTGTGTSGGVALSANAMTFGTQLDGTPSPSQSLTLTNSSASSFERQRHCRDGDERRGFC